MSRYLHRRQTHDAVHPVAVVVLLLLAALVWPSAATACAVCYGDNGGSGFVRGARWATVLMVGVTYTLIAGGVVLFVIHRRRGQRAMAEDQPSSHEGDRRLVEARGAE